MKLIALQGNYSIVRLPPDAPTPDWVNRSGFYSIARTHEELSIVCRTDAIDDAVEDREDNWRCLKVAGPLDFALTGILSSIASPLAQAGISIFAISTYDTDYVLVKDDALNKAKTVLSDCGFVFD